MPAWLPAGNLSTWLGAERCGESWSPNRTSSLNARSTHGRVRFRTRPFLFLGHGFHSSCRCRKSAGAPLPTL